MKRNSKTGSVNSTITPNRNLKIKGTKLKIEGTDTSVGVYFINTVSGDAEKVESADIVTNNPSELIIVTPDLNPGTYQVRVTTQFSGANLLKEPRSVTFDKIVTV